MSKFKKGELVIVKSCKGSGAPIDEPLEVTMVNLQYIQVKSDTGGLFTCYTAGTNKEEIILADRTSRLNYAEEKRQELIDCIKILDRDIDILKNYDSDEAYTAAKLSQILQAKDDPRAIEKLLKELKQSNYL